MVSGDVARSTVAPLCSSIPASFQLSSLAEEWWSPMCDSQTAWPPPSPWLSRNTGAHFLLLGENGVLHCITWSIHGAPVYLRALTISVWPLLAALRRAVCHLFCMCWMCLFTPPTLASICWQWLGSASDKTWTEEFLTWPPQCPGHCSFDLCEFWWSKWWISPLLTWSPLRQDDPVDSLYVRCHKLDPLSKLNILNTLGNTSP